VTLSIRLYNKQQRKPIVSILSCKEVIHYEDIQSNEIKESRRHGHRKSALGDWDTNQDDIHSDHPPTYSSLYTNCLPVPSEIEQPEAVTVAEGRKYHTIAKGQMEYISDCNRARV
jgi:hypothetical protein